MYIPHIRLFLFLALLFLYRRSFYRSLKTSFISLYHKKSVIVVKKAVQKNRDSSSLMKNIVKIDIKTEKAEIGFKFALKK